MVPLLPMSMLGIYYIFHESFEKTVCIKHEYVIGILLFINNLFYTMFADGPHSHDIAILKIKPINGKGVKFDTHVQPICLPENNTNGVDWCTVTGWGAQKRT